MRNIQIKMNDSCCYDWITYTFKIEVSTKQGSRSDVYRIQNQDSRSKLFYIYEILCIF